MALIPSQVLRVAILLSYFSILCHYKALDMPAHQTYGGSWKFLTFIDLVIQAVFFALCVLIDVSSLLTKAGENREQERQLRKLIGLRDWIMAVLAFPVGAFVVFTFWSLYLYDRELVYPKLLDNFIPQWLNHGMHTTVLPFIIIEMRTTHHRYPSRSCGLVAVCCFGVGYILWCRRPRSFGFRHVSAADLLLFVQDLLGTADDGHVGVPCPGAHHAARPPRLLHGAHCRHLHLLLAWRNT
ncbi:androgen-dependent TFPI-regulating protein isoform X1 [Syngnathus acus]|uniref:androgen-dependent TFPI-regulating protein isoform X1 n=1 Tax=Syngnathus acus TaxID=161584 RepID=UPI001885D396|nr:androgen-dependent TFPI-regulating protein isoform X1 [Syngnathus acus]